MGQEEKSAEVHRKELLSKLESIIKILNDKVEADSSIPTLRETIDTSVLTENESEPAGLLSDSSKQATALEPTDERLMLEEPLARKIQQKSLSSPIKSPDKTGAALTKMENPFLPQHIRARLYSERQSAQSMDNSASENEGDIKPSKNLHDSIIDNLIAFYLPKIEADLRRRLKALAVRESQGKDNQGKES